MPYEGLFEVKKRGGSGIRLLNGKQEHPEDERFYDSNKYSDALINYGYAKSKVLFEGFLIKDTSDDNDSISKVVTNGIFYPFHFTDGEWKLGKCNKIIEDLHKDLTLTETAIKMIYGD